MTACLLVVSILKPVDRVTLQIDGNRDSLRLNRTASRARAIGGANDYGHLLAVDLGGGNNG